MLSAPPLSLYVHLPWCVRKCPYCDFNSHALRGELPAEQYVDALLRDLEQELPLAWGRPVHSVFFGGGTPSLFGAESLERLLSGIRGMLTLTPDAEISLEANPGTTEHDSFRAYADAGINRVSLGVQSFDGAMLDRLGRIHGPGEVDAAVAAIHAAGLVNFNLDLMFALPGQTVDGALDDLHAALQCQPAHISHYQLTIEPNTAFHASPPPLPDDDLAWEMQDACARLLQDGGYENYEVSAWAKAGRQCRHNLNYWSFGDYLGIGAGAHGKITLPAEAAVRRRIRRRHPADWMKAALDDNALAEDRELSPEDRVFEFFLNQLRLRRGISKTQFTARTGLSWSVTEKPVSQAIDRGLLEEKNDKLVATDNGWRFLNEIQALFLP